MRPGKFAVSRNRCLSSQRILETYLTVSVSQHTSHFLRDPLALYQGGTQGKDQEQGSLHIRNSRPNTESMATGLNSTSTNIKMKTTIKINLYQIFDRARSAVDGGSSSLCVLADTQPTNSSSGSNGSCTPSPQQSGSSSASFVGPALVRVSCRLLEDGP